MTLYIAEAIKKIKDLDDRKQVILRDERQKCMSSYQTEADKIDTGYDFMTVRKDIEHINNEIMKLKHALNVANSTVVVSEFELTIGECLIYMAQLNNERSVLEIMARSSPKSRHTVFNGAIEYTVINYDTNECKNRLENTKALITRLQLAIDRTNLNTTINV